MTSVPAGLGARPLGGGATAFRVWAPLRERVQIEVVAPRGVTLDLRREESGHHAGVFEGVPAGAEYYLRLGDMRRPDPASRRQARGVHGPSVVVEIDAAWPERAWRNPPLDQHVLYELHVGTFTPAGTFDAVIERLPDLVRLGVTAIELMPVAEFPGGRNWGYDGVCLFAAHAAYGGVEGLRRLVDACHGHGLGVVLDVVYNHLGPEGNYLAEFGPYFTDRYKTPWGSALNFDGAGSDQVREFFIENALWWVRDCRIDGLRIDAVHAILDHTPRPFIEELTAAVHASGAASGRTIHVIAESSDNDPRLIAPRAAGGFGMDAVWNDDFHHAVRTLLTGDQAGYYLDYGGAAHLARAFTDGFAYTGQFSPFRGRRHGREVRGVTGASFVVCAQNHDQVGNRPLGDRLVAAAGLEGCKVAMGLVLLSPFVPMLFMGEEYGETAPFEYFISHTDPALVEAVRRGRREEFSWFDWPGDPPDPQAEETFRRCKLDWSRRGEGRHAQMLAYCTELLRLRRTLPALRACDLGAVRVWTHAEARALAVHRGSPAGAVLVAANCEERSVEVAAEMEPGTWARTIDSTDAAWGGPGAGAAAEVFATGPSTTIMLPARSVVLYCARSV